MPRPISTDARTTHLLWALALALGGVALLLFNLGIFAAWEPTAQYLLAGLLTGAGLGFFGGYLARRERWWRLIPGWTFLALAGMVYLTTVPGVDPRLTGALLFVGQALAFFHIYLLDREERWWAVIPGGFMLVLGGVIGLSSRTERPETLGTVLFVGLGLVFFLLYMLGQARRLWWALIPGSVLVVFGIFLSGLGRTGQNLWWRWWPLLLVVVGLGMAWRATRRPPQGHRLPLQSAPGLDHRGTPKRFPRSPRPARSRKLPGRLGEYAGPAPGASVEELPPEE